MRSPTLDDTSRELPRNEGVPLGKESLHSQIGFEALASDNLKLKTGNYLERIGIIIYLMINFLLFR